MIYSLDLEGIELIMVDVYYVVNIVRAEEVNDKANQAAIDAYLKAVYSLMREGNFAKLNYI